MLRAYNYCYYGGKDVGFFNDAIFLIFSSMCGGSDISRGGFTSLQAGEGLDYNIYLPLETFVKKETELYETLEVTIPISAGVCQKKTIRQVLVAIQRTTYLRDYTAYPSHSFINDAVKIAKVIHLLPTIEDVAGVNYKTRQGLGLTVDLPIVGWRKRYTILEKPYALDQNVNTVIQDSYNYSSGCNIDDAEFVCQQEPQSVLGWYKRDFIVSDYSKEMFSFIQDNDYWKFLIRINKAALKKKSADLLQEYGVDENSFAYRVMSPLLYDIFGTMLYYDVLPDSNIPDPSGRLIYSSASIILNILVEE